MRLHFPSNSRDQSRMRISTACLALAALSPLLPLAGAQTPRGTRDRSSTDSIRLWALENTQHLTLLRARATAAVYHGRKAVHVAAASDTTGIDRDGAAAFIDDSDFHDGTIELWVAGTISPNFPDTSVRAFVGVAFRGTPAANRFENLYLRPTNGRSDDQVRRNHAVQYESVPEYPWFRLREESPARYESYADLQPGVWTKMRLVVSGTRAQLFVNGATQPCLIVSDLKLDDTHGLIGLWIGAGTEAYFSQLRVTRKPRS
jgi:hypothetical protein